MIPVEYAKLARATPNRLLVARDEVSAKYLMLYLPPAYQSHTRKAHATVVDVDAGIRGRYPLEPGMRVLLAPGAGRKVVFGFTADDEVELWSVPVEAVRAILHDREDLEYQEGPPGDAKGWFASYGPEDEPKFDEGDKRGLR